MPTGHENYITATPASHKDNGGARHAAIVWQHYWGENNQYKTQCSECISFYEVGQIMGGN